MNNGTIKDIAAKSGVSISTVSRVINDNYPVSPEIRARVLEVMEMVHYKPNSIARSLRNRKSQMIGLIVADLANLFFMQMAKGIEQAVSPYGFNIIIASSDGDVQKERRILAALLNERPAALIITSYDNNGSQLQEFMDVGIPVVMADRYIRGFECDVVCAVNFQTAYELTNYLLNKGHRDIAIANVLLSISSGIDRYEGFLKALSEKELKPVSKWVSSGSFNQQESYKWVKETFSAPSPPTALICANNIMTIGALLAFKDLGLKIPDDVSVVSMGEIPLHALIDPQITYSQQDGFKMGECAGQMAVERIQKGMSQKYMKKEISSAILEYNSVRQI
jgi:LacI family transcriptional regulator